ncbi:hypothetical protein DRF60_19410 [Chryseobacterium elymi]|uniref:Uncharacterized protein n=1 Tax=Chryseobacterium elymi TaxID=395936 RepID=A0A3D9D627_9FLAO|nr:hypothetical protein [Chryseobacterium elymi]REC73427.1 hypothetical protein DRF60_19410 [Chryseobacterium elymi]
MKKIKPLLVILLLMITSISFGQITKERKPDRIIKKDYVIIEAFVKKITEKNIEYSMPNEDLINTLDTSHIGRIEFANGKTQTFTEAKENNDVSNTSGSKHDPSNIEITPNTIAILPVPFVNTETLVTSEELSKFAQNDVYDELIKKSSNIAPLTVQDPRTTNSLLRKAGIDYKNIDETSIEDIQNILGVDNIVAAKVSYTVTENQSSYGSTTIKSGQKDKATVSDYSNTNKNMKYEYHIYFDMYKKGNKIYTKNRSPFFTTKDSWKDSLTYLLKRSPIYIKK